MKLFFELLQVSMGTREAMSAVPQTQEEWEALFKVAAKHNLVPVTFPVIDELHDDDVVPLGIYSRWAMVAEKVQQKNEKLLVSCVRLFNRFKEDGFASCVLKGQGAAALYPRPELRHSGDIDIWVNADKDTIINYLRRFGPVSHILYHHCEVHMIKGINVEVHYMPSWMNAPLSNSRLLKYFDKVAPEQFANYDPSLGFCVPTLRFQAVHMLIHIYRHVLYEGVGLRQLMDYYYVLKALEPEDREAVLRDFKSLKMLKFAAGVMYVLKEVFNIDDSLLLCSPDDRQGRFLLEEIMISGNFGRNDIRNRHADDETGVGHALRRMTRSVRFLAYYPSEVIFMPYFILFQFTWRLFKGYLK